MDRTRNDRQDRTVTAGTATAIQAARLTAATAAPAAVKLTNRHCLDPESARVLEAIPLWSTTTPEGLATRAQLDLRTVLRRLSLLELAGLVRRREGGVARVVTLNYEHDHKGRCVSCGAPRIPAVAGEDYWCLSTCGFRTGSVSLAMILRAAVRHLERFGRGHGADVRAALAAAAVALVRTEDARGSGEDLDVEDLVESARDALGAYFDEITGQGGTPGADLVDQYGVTVSPCMLGITLDLAAARITREQVLGEGLRQLERCCPAAETVLLSITGPEDGPHDVEFLGTAEPDEMFVLFGWASAADERAFTRAGELIVRALSTSLPYYLRATDHSGNTTHQFAIADTTYRRTSQQ